MMKINIFPYKKFDFQVKRKEQIRRRVVTYWRVLTRIRLSYRRRSSRKNKFFYFCLLVYFQVARTIFQNSKHNTSGATFSH